MNWLSNLFAKFKADFDGPKAVAVEKEIETLLPIGITIAADINTIAPNKTLAELNTVATKYAVPTITALADGDETGEVAALNLGTAILQKNHAPTAAVGLLTTIMGLAGQAVNPTPTLAAVPA